MIGVEILATQEVVVETVFSLSLFCTVAGICFGVFLLVGALAGAIESDEGVFIDIAVFGLLFSIIIGLAVGFSVGTPSKYETQYKVIISDEVPMNEFVEVYEIVDQEGKIYTVRERDGK